MVANLLKKGLQDSCAFWVQCFVSTTRWQRRHCAVRGLAPGCGNHRQSFISRQKGDGETNQKKKASVDPNEPGAALDCLGSSTSFLSTLSEIQLFAEPGRSSRRFSRVPFGQTCRVQRSCLRGPLCWCQSLVLEVIFQRLGQREALDLLKPIPAQRQAGRSPTQVHEREGFSCGARPKHKN